MIVDLTKRRFRLRLSGPDRVRYLNGQVTQDVRLVVEGRGVAAAVCNAKGKMEGEIRIQEDGGRFLIDLPEELAGELPSRLEKYLVSDDCEFTPVVEYCHFHLVGCPVEKARSWQWPCEVGLALMPRFACLGSDVLAPIDQHDVVLQFLGEVGGAVLLDDAALLRLRIEGGEPAWGAELTGDTLPPEAGLEHWMIDYKKGCYIGQEVISRVKSVGRVNWRLFHIRVIGGDELPPLGTSLYHADDLNRSVGRITSRTDDDGKPARALGYVRRPHDVSGQKLLAMDGGLGFCCKVEIEELRPLVG